MLKIGVVDDHTLFRKSLISLKKSVDILLLDIQMPIMDGYETCKKVITLYPNIKILIVSHLLNKESIHKAMEAGAHGYFSKNAEPNDLETAIKNIHDKGFYFEPGIGAVLHDVIMWDKKEIGNTNLLTLLSDKELSIISLFCKGYTSSEIADQLCVNIRTIESYRHRIIDKTEAKSFMNVILMAIKYNFIPITDLLAKA